jgi:hypothetical protein
LLLKRFGWPKRPCLNRAPFCYFYGDLHCFELQRSIVGVQRDIGCVAPIAGSNAVTAGTFLGAIEGEPAPADKGFEPGVKVHGFKLVKITDHHARRDVEAASK